MSNNYPIQKVEFRGHKDNFLKEGGGDSSQPKWVNSENIKKNSIRVRTSLGKLSDLFIKNNDITMPILTTLKINEEATAKTHRASIHDMVNVPKKRNVLGATTVGKLLVKIDSRHDLDIIIKKFDITKSNISLKERKGLSAIMDIEQFKPYIEGNIKSNDIIKVHLADYLNFDLNKKSKELLKYFCDQKNTDFEELYYSSELRLFKLSNPSKELLDELATMDGVLSIRKMPTIEFHVASEPDQCELEVMQPSDSVDYPIAGILDSGVAPIEHMNPWLLKEENTGNFTQDDIIREHGTAVAGILNYGDFLENKNLTKCIPCKIISCIINADTIIYENELIMHIQKAIENNPEIKVWNLSQGINSQINDNSFSDLAVALDDIQKKFKVLICKSAGNIQNPLNNSDSLRLNKGADSIMSLVVGSITHSQETDKDACINDRSPFSRIGPGIENIIKPDLVHYGGNLDTGVSSFSIYGNQIRIKGTSFSTPRITSLASNLHYQFRDEVFDPLLIRAILIHNANYPNNINKTNEELRKEMGFGLPPNINSILFNNPDEITMIFSHTMNKGTDIVSLDFPFPNSLVDEDGYYYGEITVTLAVDPVLNANQGIEYCQSQVDVFLNTYSTTRQVDLSKPSTMRNEVRMSSDTTNVLSKSKYSTRAFKTRNGSERTLIENGCKYQPIKKYQVSLSNMTPSNKKKALKSNMKWALKLVGLYREAAENARDIDGVDISQKVVLIVTVKDPNKRGIVYNESKELLGTRGYIHNDITINQSVQLHNIN